MAKKKKKEPAPKDKKPPEHKEKDPKGGADREKVMEQLRALGYI